MKKIFSLIILFIIWLNFIFASFINVAEWNFWNLFVKVRLNNWEEYTIKLNTNDKYIILINNLIKKLQNKYYSKIKNNRNSYQKLINNLENINKKIDYFMMQPKIKNNKYILWILAYLEYKIKNTEKYLRNKYSVLYNNSEYKNSKFWLTSQEREKIKKYYDKMRTKSKYSY